MKAEIEVSKLFTGVTNESRLKIKNYNTIDYIMVYHVTICDITLCYIMHISI